MTDIKIDSPFDFSLVIERMIRETKTKVPHGVLVCIEELAQECFMYGYKAGQLEQNKPIDLKQIGGQHG